MVDTPDSGSGGGNSMLVQVQSRAITVCCKKRIKRICSIPDSLQKLQKRMKKPNPRSINMNTSKKLFYIFGGVSLLIFLLVGTVIYAYVKSAIVEIQESNLRETSHLVKRKIDTIVNLSVKNNLRSVSRKTESLIRYYYEKYKKGEMTEANAIAKIKEHVLYGPYGLIGETGYIALVKDDGLLFVHPKSEGVNIKGVNFWPQVETVLKSEEQEGYIEYDWKNTGETKPRRKAGYITCFKPWNLIVWASSYKSEFNYLINKSDFREDLLFAGKSRSGYTYVINTDGELVIHPEKEGENLSSHDFAREMIAKKEGRIEYYWQGAADKKPGLKTAYYNYIPQFDWITVTCINHSELMAPLFFLRIFIIAGIIAATAIFLIISLLVGRLIAGKIETFQSIFKIAGTGDLTRQYSSDSPPWFQDEIDDMGKVFNLFMGDYRDVLHTLRTITDKIMGLIQSLASLSQETSSTANQQAAAVKEIVSTMEDVDALSKSIEKKITEITKITENTQFMVKNGFGKVKENITRMESINTANQTTIDGIKFLSEKIDNIWDIVNIINSIADQTKIIAFNAELEASAAGEAGKNFQIVATEIRRLADSTVHSTNEIRERITEIQKSSDRLILTSEDGTEKIRDGSRITREINDLFENILGSAEVSSESTRQISKSINQQVVTFEQILIAIKQIAEGVDNIAAATKETAGASDDLSGVSEQIETILKKYTLEKKPAVSGYEADSRNA